MFWRYLTFFSLTCLAVMSAWGHHSDAGLDVDSIVALDGTVTEFAFRNPHVYIGVETTDLNGESVEWSLQMSGANGMRRRGWTADTLLVGDQVAVRAHPALDGRPYGVVDSIERAGGLRLTAVAAAPEAQSGVRTSTVAGKWRADRSKLVSYPGGFDGFFHAQLKLTERGLAAQAQYDPLSADNPESTA